MAAGGAKDVADEENVHLKILHWGDGLDEAAVEKQVPPLRGCAASVEMAQSNGLWKARAAAVVLVCLGG
jgi:hypothetical protein